MLGHFEDKSPEGGKRSESPAEFVALQKDGTPLV